MVALISQGKTKVLKKECQAIWLQRIFTADRAPAADAAKSKSGIKKY
jgi:hypothetical protein